ncbi:hypothetical protein CPB85DRAFT_1433209 [Mucidula mucida]|nr:hypothetical protein CPB85DRAFT_1433209 [Mucidula mucida]
MATHPPAQFSTDQIVQLTQQYAGSKSPSSPYAKGDSGVVQAMWQTGPGNAYHWTYAIKFTKDGRTEMGVPENILELA